MCKGRGRVTPLNVSEKCKIQTTVGPSRRWVSDGDGGRSLGDCASDMISGVDRERSESRIGMAALIFLSSREANAAAIPFEKGRLPPRKH